MICCQAKTINFDVNFVNYEDPEVLERFIGPEFEKYWKETYGLDYVRRVSFITTTQGNVTDYAHDLKPLAVHCVEAEFRYYFAFSL